MTELKQLEELVNERKKLAKERGIHNKISAILHNYGHDTYNYNYWGSEHRRAYKSGKLLIRETTIGSRLSDSYGEYGSSSSTWAEVLFGDELVYRENPYCEYGKMYYPIDVYIPGEWAGLLERPYNEIMNKKAEKEKQKKEQEKIRRAEEEQRKINHLQKNFGLGGK